MRDTKNLYEINADLATHRKGCKCPGHMMIEIKTLRESLKHWQDVAATYLLEIEKLKAKLSSRAVTQQVDRVLDAAKARGDG